MANLRNRRFKLATVKRGESGSEIVQVVLGGIILIPIALFLIDAIFLALCATINADAAKLAARAAANEQTEGLARNAAEASIQQHSNGIAKIKLAEFSRTPDQVTVLTKIGFRLPAPFPFFDHTELNSGYVVEPVVSITKDSK